ncbi:hypothetical protein SAMN05444008_12239 [Cnuella takakiae]|uniref:Uncharacterized protein n=1 Tax=Cnuella takakiae TaxID=1302690 RepID=A0A1M5I7K1_9BACT|nr:hypothetical protein [Cnuella takakiae]SHG24304.1 hypothetical protein SAMN05444008_12239 [Cnuella takakiae]
MGINKLFVLEFFLEGMKMGMLKGLVVERLLEPATGLNLRALLSILLNILTKILAGKEGLFLSCGSNI